MNRVAVLGSGAVGQTLADGFLKNGYAVMRGSRDVGKLGEWKAKAQGEASVGTFAEAAAWGDTIVLAVKGTAAEAVVAQVGAANLAGKVVIDTTNPIADAPPTNGVLQYFIAANESLMERLQTLAPDGKFVKAFSCVGAPLMVNPQLPGGPPTMFICGNDAGAKQATQTLLEKFGWDVEDIGGVEGARAIEPLCVLWCMPGFTKGRWAHAFKLLRA